MEKKETKKKTKKETYKDILRSMGKLNKVGEYLLSHEPWEVTYVDMKAVLK